MKAPWHYIRWRYLSWRYHKDREGWGLRQDFSRIMREARALRKIDPSMTDPAIQDRVRALGRAWGDYTPRYVDYQNLNVAIEAVKFGVPLPTLFEPKWWSSKANKTAKFPDLSEEGLAHVRRQIREERGARLWWLREATPAITTLLGLGGVVVAIITVWRTT